MELINKSIVLPPIPCDGDLDLVLHRTDGSEFKMHREDGEDLNKDFWKYIQQTRVEEWTKTVRDYEANPGDVYYAWHYLNNHPAFWKFDRLANQKMPIAERVHEQHLTPEYGIHRCVDISVVKVDKETRSTEDNGTKETEVWIELGKQSWPEDPSTDPNKCDRTFHDHLLDCGGPTLDAAILHAAHNVWEVYGNDRRICDGPYEKRNYVTVLEPDEFEEYMAELGYPKEVNEHVRRAAQRLNEIITKLEDK